MDGIRLDYHDLLSLFEFLDNGDGQITLNEFIEAGGGLCLLTYLDLPSLNPKPLTLDPKPSWFRG